MEVYLMPVVSFIACVYAYILGTKHGISVSKGSVPQPIREVVNTIKSIVPDKQPEVSEIDLISSYDYESALLAVQKEHLEGRR